MEYDSKTLLVIAQALVSEGGFQGNPLMDKPQVRQTVNQILEIRNGSSNNQHSDSKTKLLITK